MKLSRRIDRIIDAIYYCPPKPNAIFLLIVGASIILAQQSASWLTTLLLLTINLCAWVLKTSIQNVIIEDELKSLQANMNMLHQSDLVDIKRQIDEAINKQARNQV
jgi:hypothetical protein